MRSTKPVRAAKTVLALRRIRSKAFDRIAGYPNVVGSMIGCKIQNGETRRELGLTILVSSKWLLADIPKADRIPRSAVVDGTSVLLDVLEVGPLRRHSMVFSTDGALLTYDGTENGTLSSMCRSQFGLLGLSCAHVLEGTDGDPATTTPVTLWSVALHRYVMVGQSVFAMLEPGTGVPGQYGFGDAAVFTLQHPELLERGKNRHVVRAVPAVPSARVVADGVVQGTRTGRIIGIEQTIRGLRADVVIRVDAPGTFRGDSGMLWKDMSGRPIAIHTYGEDVGPSEGSPVSIAMLASRVEQRLGVEFLQ